MDWVLSLGAIVFGLGLFQVPVPLPPAPAPPESGAGPSAAPAVVPPVPAENAPLTNDGKPMRVDFQCTDDDILWGGLDCTEDQPCRIYVELSEVESVGNKIFVIGNIHSPAVTLYSLLLASEDSGKTWREPFERIRGVTLDHIQFLDFEMGWISGETVQPLPRDPFFLITSDGGKTWRKRPVHGESRPGGILQFWFSSRNEGAMVIDRGASEDGGRYELYNSPNSGETWMVKEVTDRLPRLKHTGAPNTDWRLRADPATKSFKVERREGERWVALGSFLVATGMCRPEPPRQAPPPGPAPDNPPSGPPAPPSLHLPPAKRPA